MNVTLDLKTFEMVAEIHSIIKDIKTNVSTALRMFDNVNK